MHGWESVETVRCAGCAIYTPRGDVVLDRDGRPRCGPCLPAAPAPEVEVPSSVADDEWVVARRPASLAWAPGPVRMAIAALLILTLAFPIAACVSQL